MTSGTNEFVLYTLAQVAITFAGFSGVVVAFRLHGAEAWFPTELRTLWLLLGDSFLVLFFSLLPLPRLLRTGPLTLLGASATPCSVPGSSSVTY